MIEEMAAGGKLRTGYEFEGRWGASFQSGHALSLTLTLSRWERGKPFDPYLKSVSC
jgi:hypothetical protein